MHHQRVKLWRAFRLGIVGLTLLALPVRAAELRILAAGAVRTAGPGVPHRRGTGLSWCWRPGEEANRRERPEVARPLRDPR